MDILEQIPAPPSDAVFSLVKVEKVSIPHPYCITPKHVVIASDKFGGMLGQAALDYADKHGVRCGMPGCNLKASEHESHLTLFIRVPQNRNLNAVPGLHVYLVSIEEQAEKLGIQGFAFPT